MRPRNSPGTTYRCRACQGLLHHKPLISYQHMPRIAQFLPDKKTLPNDRGTTLVVYQCASCGLVQLTGKPVPYYKQVIRSSGFSEAMQTFRRRQFQQFVAEHGLAGKKIIEIGCGNGEYLGILRQFCRRSCGLEAGRAARQTCVRAGWPVFAGFVDAETYRIPRAPYDAFFMMNFLEHVPHPRTALRGICHNLTAQAVGLIEVPNFTMILDTQLFADFSTEHLSYFTRETFRRILETSGFDVNRLDVIWQKHILSAQVKKKQPVNLDGMLRQKESLRREMVRYLAQFGGKKIAVWGAGHHALATIALLGLRDKIQYVVDSAPYKQGKYTPVTHLPIVGPEQLRREPVAAVVVMASSYAGEVASILRKHYRHIRHVAVLQERKLAVIA